MKAGKRHLKGDILLEDSGSEVSALRCKNGQLKQLVAEVSLKNRIFRKSLSGLE
ncbi:MAG: hypothetical protein AB2L12_01530 [Smithellaceae bacterium]